jgi:hypothetical protein
MTLLGDSFAVKRGRLVGELCRGSSGPMNRLMNYSFCALAVLMTGGLVLAILVW